MFPKSPRLYLVLPFLLGGFGPNAWSAAEVLAADSPAESPARQRSSDERDAGVIVKLTPQEVQALNEKLRRAMALYYDQSYRLALPILEEIAARIDTMDVLYWLGHAAAKSGQPDLAIAQFKTMLERNPDLLGVRVELASAYLQKGDGAAAKAELEKVLAAKPPDTLRSQIEQVVANIQLSEKRFFATVRGSIGPMYDTNVNVGPKDDTIILPGGIGSLTSTKREGWLVNTNLNADLLYDFGQKEGFVWRNTVYFQDNTYTDRDNRDFNFVQTDVRTALEHYAPGMRVRLPLGLIDRRFSNERLSQAFYVAPALEFNLTRSADFTLGYRYEDETFKADGTGGQDNVTHTASFGPSYRFKTGKALHFLSLLGSYAERDADASRFSYDDWSVGPAYFARFENGTEVYADARYLDRDYRAPALLFDAAGDRSDKRYIATVAVSRTFYKNYFVSASYTYIRNDSNVALFDYTKSLSGLNFGVNFNF